MSARSYPRTLEGKVAIVTGASRGIGEAIAFDLASRGARVTLTYTSEKSKTSVDNLISRITSEANSSAISVQCDLKIPEAPQGVIEKTIKHFGAVDILVNNAAAFNSTRVEDTTIEHFDEIFHLNVRAALLMVQAALPHLRRPGRIINISSVASRQGMAGVGAYAASKAALEGYTRCWAMELGKDGTTVNAVTSGPVESEMLDQVPEDIKGPQMKATPVEQRAGRAEEIASIVAFLAGPDSSWVSGQCISASGGLNQY